MEHIKDNITFDEVNELIKSYIDDTTELEKIKNAYLFALEKHEGQYRKSGEEYIIHPLNVVKILTTVYADSETLQAGFLHDVVEDSDCTLDEIVERFGSEVAKIVDGVTKLSRLHFSTENEYLIEYYKKIIVGMSEDVRVIIVKLADRLHNMRTLWALPVEKQTKKAHEALDILAPIADHLGIHKIKSELEDLSLRYLKPDVFYDIAERLNKTKAERDKTVALMMDEVRELLLEHDINFEIKGRAKSIYSIYNKLNKGKKFSEIYDLLAMRIIVETKQECYLVLGLIHSKFKPMPKRFKDYIAMPKLNMYQSLHTTIFGTDGYLFEIQIRTRDMDEVAENGIASHWSYKEHKEININQTPTEQKLQFFKSIIDLSNDKMSSEDFVNSVKDEVLNNNIYCFSPKGDVFELPIGATPLDFAYRVHTRVGETTVGALVNNVIEPLDYELHNNDIVKIITNKNAHPSKEWLNMVKSTATKNKIKSYFTKSEKDIYIEHGKDILEKELRKRKLQISNFFSDENKKLIFDELKVDSVEDVYLEIGNGKTAPNSVINVIYKQEEDLPKPKKYESFKNNENDIIVSGIGQVKVNLAHCCLPVYGDDIIGYITKGNGISIHRSSCHNLEMLEARNVDVKWNEKSNNLKYLSEIIIYSNTNEDKMISIIEKMSMNNVITSEVRKVYRAEVITYEVKCYVTTVEQLNRLLRVLEKEPYIERVERLIH